MTVSQKQLIVRKRTRLFFSAVFQALAILVALSYAVFEISGSNDFFLYLVNDLIPFPKKFVFVLGFGFTYIFALAFCSRSLSIPSFDFFNKIIVINISCLAIYVTILAIARISVFSRTVFVVELILTTLLLLLFFSLRFRLFPPRIAVPKRIHQEFADYQGIEWVPYDSISTTNQHVDLIAVSDNLVVQSGFADFRSDTLLPPSMARVSESDLLELLSGQVQLSSLTASVLAHLSPPRAYFFTKRIGELLLVITLSPFVFILCLLLGLLIKVDTAGPMLFRQRRIGLNGQEFWINKLRTMAHSKVATPKGQFAAQGDRRITGIGRWIRAYRLDELPQFWNILCGEMSLIGPRPEQPEFVEEFSASIPLYPLRHAVRPGITGWAQIRYGYASSEAQTRKKLEYDLFYVKHMSIWLDFNILLSTLATVIFRRGAR